MNIFAQFELDSLTKSTKPLKINRMSKIQEETGFQVFMNSRLMDVARYFTPFGDRLLPKQDYDTAVITIQDDLDNSQFLTEKLAMEIIKMDVHSVKQAFIRIEQKLDGLRWLMSTWRLSCAVGVIGMLSLGLTSVSLILIVIMRLMVTSRS